MHNDLLTQLNKPIPAGKRNNTLFAIGSDMSKANYPDWEVEILRRGQELRLDVEEIDKIISNVTAYA